MSGKSTLLRAIGLNAVLAQAGAPVCALAPSMPPSDLETSIRVQDSLEHGLLVLHGGAGAPQKHRRCRRAPDPHDGRVLFYLLDEILQGTNTAERAIAVRAWPAICSRPARSAS